VNFLLAVRDRSSIGHLSGIGKKVFWC